MNNNPFQSYSLSYTTPQNSLSRLPTSNRKMAENSDHQILNDDNGQFKGMMDIPGSTTYDDDHHHIAVEEEAEAGKKKATGAGKKKSRKHRYAFQTRSQVDILDDGYKWRKYGQKAVKNNNFPRSYYRCTHEGCSVKKQIQRLSKDEVVTTYEGMHSHPIEKSTDNFEHILSQMQIYTCN